MYLLLCSRGQVGITALSQVIKLTRPVLFPYKINLLIHTETKQRFVCLLLEVLSIKTLALGDNLLKKLSLC